MSIPARFPHSIQFSCRYYIKARVLKRSNSWWTRGIRTMSAGVGSFGLARGASFNEIDRAVIEMRTKLARDNTRPLISAATEERGDGNEHGGGWKVGSSLELIRFRKFGKVLRANKRDLTNCTRSRWGDEVVHFGGWRMDVRVDIEIDKFAAGDGRGRSRIDSCARQRGNEFRTGWL